MLDQQTLQTFLDDGFVALPSFFSFDQISTINERVERFIHDIVPTMPIEHVFYEDKDDRGTLKQLQGMFDYDPFFHELMFGGPVEELARTLLQHEVRGVNLQYFNKPAGIGQPTPPHQDGFYFMLEPNEAVTMWVALEEVNEENGCVRYLRGSHKRGMRPHSRTQTLGFSQGITDYGTDEDDANEIACPAQAGDLLAHHALTVHRANGNVSTTRSRRALGFVYFSTAVVESEEKKARHEALLRELKESGKVG